MYLFSLLNLKLSISISGIRILLKKYYNLKVAEERDLDEKVQEADELYLKLEKDAKLRNEAANKALNPQAANNNPFGNAEETATNGTDNPFEDNHEPSNPFGDDEEDIDEKNPFASEDDLVESEQPVDNNRQANGLSPTDTSEVGIKFVGLRVSLFFIK